MPKFIVISTCSNLPSHRMFPVVVICEPSPNVLFSAVVCSIIGVVGTKGQVPQGGEGGRGGGAPNHESQATFS